jgi:hypothetical protein
VLDLSGFLLERLGGEVEIEFVGTASGASLLKFVYLLPDSLLLLELLVLWRGRLIFGG